MVKEQCSYKRLRLIGRLCGRGHRITAPLTASAVPPSAASATATFDYTQNMHPLGFSPNDVPLDNDVPGAGVFNSDLAFWGNTAVPGHVLRLPARRRLRAGEPEGDRRLDGVRQPTETIGNQGDVIIWGDLSSGPGTRLRPRPRSADAHPGDRPGAVHDAGRVLR